MSIPLYNLSLSRWQQQTVDVWVSHHGTRTELFCGSSGWRIVMSYENPQRDVQLLSVDLKVPLDQLGVVHGASLVLGQRTVLVLPACWKLDQLRAARWGVAGYSSHTETTTKDCVRNSLDLCFDLLGLISLTNGLSAEYIHLENVDRKNPKELVNVWYSASGCNAANSLHIFHCTEYVHRLNSKLHVPRRAHRYSVILPIGLIRQLAALVECCDTGDFAGRADDLLRIGTEGTVWLCTGTGCRRSIAAVCCNAKVQWE